jgi:hypothetical protein
MSGVRCGAKNACTPRLYGHSEGGGGTHAKEGGILFGAFLLKYLKFLQTKRELLTHTRHLKKIRIKYFCAQVYRIHAFMSVRKHSICNVTMIIYLQLAALFLIDPHRLLTIVESINHKCRMYILTQMLDVGNKYTARHPALGDR